MKAEYEFSHDKNLIVPESGTGPFLRFINLENTHAHRFSIGSRMRLPQIAHFDTQYHFIRAFSYDDQRLQLPRTPRHSLSGNLSTDRFKVTELDTIQVSWFSGAKASWQSSYFLDNKNFVEFSPRLILQPYLGLDLKDYQTVARKSTVSCVLQGDFSFPEAAQQSDILGNSYSVYHTGVEGNPLVASQYSLTIRGEF